eukprot:5376184-Prymnesium_polylepis.1
MCAEDAAPSGCTAPPSSSETASTRCTSGGTTTSSSLSPASAATVCRCSTVPTLTSRPNASVKRRASTTACNELPPSSKKLASTLTISASSLSTAANTSRTAASAAVRGATTAARAAAADARSCSRSIWPDHALGQK